MVTKSMDIHNSILLTTIRNLGEQSKESYVILDAKTNCILECNECFCMLINASHTEILKKDYFEMLSNQLQTTTVEMIKEKIHSGAMVTAKLHHHRFEKPPF